MEIKVSEITNITMEKAWEELENYFKKISGNIHEQK